ncbi:MAG: EamA family transporter [Dethiosulfovibrio peptidovorans]|nr:MAG: EamA family transporter [Dethiosulfovibrio peptidovorans]
MSGEQNRFVRRGVVVMLLAGLAWGTTGTIQSQAPSGTVPLALGWARLAFGGGFLLLTLIVRGKARLECCLIPWAILPGLAMAGFHVFFFLTLARCGVAMGTMLGIGSSLIAAGLFGWIIGERPSGLWWGAVCLALAGLFFLVSLGEGMSLDFMGLALGFASGGFYAMIGVELKALARRGLSALERPAVALISGALCLLPATFFVDLSWLVTPRGLAVALGLGGLSAALPYGLFSVALAYITVGQAYTLGLMEPLTATCLGIFLLGERPPLPAYLGMVLILLSLALSGWDAGRRDAKDNSSMRQVRQA